MKNTEIVYFTFSPQYPLQYWQQPSFSSPRPQKVTRGATCRVHVFSMYAFFKGIRREGKQLSPPYDAIIWTIEKSFLNHNQHKLNAPKWFLTPCFALVTHPPNLGKKIFASCTSCSKALTFTFVHSLIQTNKYCWGRKSSSKQVMFMLLNRLTKTFL